MSTATHYENANFLRAGREPAAHLAQRHPGQD